jgi:hypothetical protein
MQDNPPETIKQLLSPIVSINMGAGPPCTGYEAVLSVSYSTMTDVTSSSTFRHFPHQQLFKSTPTAALKDIGMYFTRLLRQSLMGRRSVTTLLG